MKVYLSSPTNQLQAHALREMPVLFSFATWTPFLQEYQQSYPRVLIDSGAFSELNTGKAIDLGAYREWSEPWRQRADAIAGLDDISGDWRRSLKNYAEVPWSFPTYHDTDPPELLADLIAMAQERCGWLGIGLKPPRTRREPWLRRTLEQIPEGIHVHGWALRNYAHLPRIDSFDSTNWLLDAMKLRETRGLGFLTIAECLDLVVLRYKREGRNVSRTDGEHQSELF